MEISVITAVYNGEEYLAQAIESILEQSYKGFEYIIVNDGSRDKTKEILDGLTDPRVKVIHLKQNSGAAHALNTGIEAAGGKWIALQDADDLSSRQRLQRQWEYIKGDPRLVAVGSLIKCIGGNESVAGGELLWEEAFFNQKNNLKLYQFYSTPICHGSGFFLKKAFEQIGGYDPAFKIAYDYDLWTRMFEVGEISRVPEVLYKYRIHKGSLAHNNKMETTKEVLLSTFKCIALLRFNHLKRKPGLIMLGLKSNLDFYREKLAPVNHYVKIALLELSAENAQRTVYDYRAQKIDGVILPAFRQIGKLISYFEKGGLSYGENLFVMWMPGRGGW